MNNPDQIQTPSNTRIEVPQEEIDTILAAVNKIISNDRKNDPIYPIFCAVESMVGDRKFDNMRHRSYTYFVYFTEAYRQYVSALYSTDSKIPVNDARVYGAALCAVFELMSQLVKRPVVGYMADLAATNILSTIDIMRSSRPAMDGMLVEYAVAKITTVMGSVPTYRTVPKHTGHANNEAMRSLFFMWLAQSTLHVIQYLNEGNLDYFLGTVNNPTYDSVIRQIRGHARAIDVSAVSHDNHSHSHRGNRRQRRARR